jgi:hypothetical protein
MSADKFVKLKMNGWKWTIREAGLLDGWFENYDEFVSSSTVKVNPVRTVFKVNDLFFVKMEQPEGFWRKLRGFLAPKAKREFATGFELEMSGVPVVKHLGWGHRGGSSMLLTEAFPNAVSVLQYWNEQIIHGHIRSIDFLPQLAEFLNLFLLSGFFHPDFHLGNILYNPQDKSFALVDVYGIRRPENLSSRQKKRHQHIIFELKDGITDKQAVGLIIQLGFADDENSAAKVWEKGLHREVEFANAVWPKRKVQILDNYHKFVMKLQFDETIYLLRKNPGGNLAVNFDQVPDCLNGNNFDVVRLPASQAEDIWLKSFRLELLGIDHIRPLGFEKNNILYFEKSPDGARIAPPVEQTAFITKVKRVGAETKPENIYKFPNGRIVIRDIKDLDIDF